MAQRPTGQTSSSSEPGRRSARLLVPAAALASALALAAIALAARGTFTVSSVHSSSLGEQIVVDSHGQTLYALSPETADHVLCKSKECLKFWPPLTVSSHKAKLRKGPGVKGKLGLLRRRHGEFQVTLRGMPLYRFAGDHGAGQTNGQGIKSFGGTWSAATASPSSGPAANQQQVANTPANGNPNNGTNENHGAPPPPVGSTGTTTTSTMTTSTSMATTSSYGY
jgi:predicted lipoprotein with Yx(FWY)xxD motif